MLTHPRSITVRKTVDSQRILPDLLDFDLPLGLSFALSSLATPKFTTSYQLGTLGAVDGSLGYLYSSAPLTEVVAQSDRIPLPALLRSYRQLDDPLVRKQQAWPSSLSYADLAWPPSTGQTGGAVAALGGNPALRSLLDSPYLLYGRLYLPQSTLEAALIKRLTPALQVQVSAVSAESLRNGGTILALAQYDERRFGVEALASTDGGLLGVRGLYNFGGDLSNATPPAQGGAGGVNNINNNGATERERIYGRFSVGGELYYGTLNKSGGMSLGTRFATLPAHRGTPLTATLTINPLMGNISATYAVQARQYCSLATRMDFNFYSYESDWKVGLELWSKRRPGGFLLGVEPDPTTHGPEERGPGQRPRDRERSFQAKLEWRLDDPEPSDAPVITPARAQIGDEYLGVLKARMDQHLRIGLLWEGRVQSLIFSIGTGIDLHKLDQAFRTIGLQIQYSS